MFIIGSSVRMLYSVSVGYMKLAKSQHVVMYTFVKSWMDP